MTKEVVPKVGEVHTAVLEMEAVVVGLEVNEVPMVLPQNGGCGIGIEGQ